MKLRHLPDCIGLSRLVRLRHVLLFFSPETQKEQLMRCSLANLCYVNGQVSFYTLAQSEPLPELPPSLEYLGQGVHFGQTPVYL